MARAWAREAGPRKAASGTWNVMQHCMELGGAGGIRQGHLTPFGKFGAVDKPRNGLAWGNFPAFDYTPDAKEAEFRPKTRPSQTWLPPGKPKGKVRRAGRHVMANVRRTPEQRRRLVAA